MAQGDRIPTLKELAGVPEEQPEVDTTQPFIPKTDREFLEQTFQGKPGGGRAAVPPARPVRRAQVRPPADPTDVIPREFEGVQIEDVSGGPQFGVARFGEDPRQPFFRQTRQAPEMEVTGIRRKQGESVQDFLGRQQKFERVQQARDQMQRQRVRAARRQPSPVREIAQGVEAFTGLPVGKLATLGEIAGGAYAQGVGGSLISAVKGLEQDPTAVVTGPFSEVLRSQLKDPGLIEAFDKQRERVSGVFRPAVQDSLRRIGLGDLDPSQLQFLNQAEQETWTAKVFGALGGTVPQALLAAIPGGQGASAAFGALQGAGSAFMDAKQSGATDEQARRATGFGSVLGLIDALGGPESGDFLKPGIGSRIIRLYESAGEEAATEFIQSIGEDVNAALIAGYDPKKVIGERALEDAVLGGLIGVGFAGAGELARGSVPEVPENLGELYDQAQFGGQLAQRGLTIASDQAGGQVVRPIPTLQELAAPASSQSQDIPPRRRSLDYEDLALASQFESPDQITAAIKELDAKLDQAADIFRDDPGSPEAEQYYTDLFNQIDQLERIKNTFDAMDQGATPEAQPPEDSGTSPLQRFMAGADPRLQSPEGTPLPLYHGTGGPQEIDRIDLARSGQNYQGGENLEFGPGFYLTASPQEAGGYAMNNSAPLRSVEDLLYRFSPLLTEEGANAIARQDPEFAARLENSADPVKEVKYYLLEKGQELTPEFTDMLGEAIYEVDKSYVGAPATYSLYTNIRKPFDADVAVTSEEASRILGRQAPEMSGRELYEQLSTSVGSKAEANRRLETLGYDGIVHMTYEYDDAAEGTPGEDRVFETQEEAQAEAQRTGGQVIPLEDGTFRAYGMRNWIAFQPTQMKSAIGNVGTFDPNNPSIVASQDLGLDLRELEERANRTGRPIALSPESAATMQTEAEQLQKQLLTMEPGSDEFNTVASRVIELRRAVEDAQALPDGGIRDSKGLAKYLVEVNAGSAEAAAVELERLGYPVEADITRREQAESAIRFLEGQQEGFGASSQARDPQKAAEQAREDQRRLEAAAARYDPSRLRLETAEDRHPVLFMPNDLFLAMGSIAGNRGPEGAWFPALALNFEMRYLKGVMRVIALALPADKAKITNDAILNAAVESERMGLGSFIFMNEDRMVREGRSIEKTRLHEQLHGGQVAIAGKPKGKVAITELTTAEFDLGNPTIQKAAASPGAQNVFGTNAPDYSLLAAELPAYIAEGRGAEFGLSPKEQVDYILDYLDEIVKNRGVKGLEVLTRISMQKGTVQEVFNIGRSKYGLEELGGGLERDSGAEGESADRGGPGESRPMGAGVLGAVASGDVGGGRQGGDEEAPRGGAGTTEREGGGLEPGAPVLGAEPVFNEPLETTAGGPPAPPERGLGPARPPSPPMIDVILSDPYVKGVKNAMIDLIDSGKIKRDPNIQLPITEEVMMLMARGKLKPEIVETALARYNVSWSDFIEGYGATMTKAGRTLNYQSQIQRYWDALYESDPALYQKLVPADKQVRKMLDDLKATELGKDWWDRIGDLMKKQVLTDLAIAAKNVVGTLRRIPIEMVGAATTGGLMAQLQPGKYDATGMGRMKAAYQGAMRELEAYGPLLAAFKPSEFRKVLNRAQLRGEETRPEYKQIFNKLLEFYPGEYKRLRGLASGLDAKLTPKAALDAIEQRLPFVNDIKKRRELKTELRVLQQRQKENDSVAGKVFKGVDWAYDKMLTPLTFQEIFFRGPMFMGALRTEAEKAGFDLNDLLLSQRFEALPDEVIEKAVDKAIDLTYAYSPRREKSEAEEAPARRRSAKADRVIADGLALLNRLGPLNFVIGEPFGKAMYNGLRWAYHYSPIGMITPAMKITYDIRHGYEDDTGAQVKGAPAIREEDVNRMIKGVIGTAIWGIAQAIRGTIGGDDWWEITTGITDEKGKKVVYDARRDNPDLAGALWLVDYVDRVREGRDIDRSVREWGQLYLNMKPGGYQQSPLVDLLDDIKNYWGGGDDANLGQPFASAGGRLLSIPLTPLINLRNLYASWNEDENRKKDFRGNEWLGPSIDKISWLRQSLPDARSLTEEGPVQLQASPALRQAGVGTVSRGYATRELDRLGIRPDRWIRRDPDMHVDNAQREAFAMGMEELGRQFEADEGYQSMSDADKQMVWDFMVNRLKLAEMAKKAALAANPAERVKRSVTQKVGLPPIVRDKSGFTQELKREVEGAKGER